MATAAVEVWRLEERRDKGTKGWATGGMERWRVGASRIDEAGGVKPGLWTTDVRGKQSGKPESSRPRVASWLSCDARCVWLGLVSAIVLYLAIRVGRSRAVPRGLPTPSPIACQLSEVG